LDEYEDNLHLNLMRILTPLVHSFKENNWRAVKINGIKTDYSLK
jgi:hypothetical protein